MEVKEFTEEEKKKILNQYARMSFANLRKSILQDLINNKNESVIYKKYPKEQVIKMLENPQKNEKQIRELSNYLYLSSSHYRRLVDYFSSILLYNYIIIPTRIPDKVKKIEFKKTYNYVVGECEKYNLKHEAIKAIKVVIRDGVFYGIPYETEDSFYIRPFDSKYAKISSIEDGAYMFSIDMNYFVGKEYLLDTYGDNFKKAYDLYKGNKEKKIKGDKNKRWYEVPDGICLKCDESDPYYSLPYYSGMLLNIYDLEDYRMLQKAKTENDNYRALGLQLPTDSDGVPLLEFEQNEMYFNHIVDNIANDGVGVFMSPFKVIDFSFASSKTAEVNSVDEAEKALFNSAGVTGGLFLSDITSSSSITLSVKPDEQIAYAILLQLQQYFNKRLKKKDLPYGFKIEFTPQSIFNNTEYVDRFSKSAQYGVCSKLSYAASLGYSPSDVIGLTYLEEDILQLGDKKWTEPLVSSNTTSNSPESQGGRPTAEESGNQIGEAGEKTRNADSNDNK